MGAVVRYAEEVLGRAHGLFGNPSRTGPFAGGGLALAADRTSVGRQSMSGLYGRLPAAYGAFADDARVKLDGLADVDDRLRTTVSDAAAADRSGHDASGRVVNGASVDTTRMSPLTSTPAGQRALVTALRDRIAQQRRVVAAYQARDARLAALLRTLSYRQGGGLGAGGATPFGGSSGGGTSFGGTGSGITPASLANWARPQNGSGGMAPVQTVGGRLVPSGAGGAAVTAALTKRGRPYVWGAKGPNAFDCSGLTQWAWHQAGVGLGGDTYAQIRDGLPVPPGEVRAGDLIFPTSSFGEGGQPGPGHVMLAISATEVVHAPHTGDVVRVAPMPSGFVARRPVPTTLS